jgi:hypothetical protein
MIERLYLVIQGQEIWPILTKSRETHKNACRGLGYFMKFRAIYFLSYILRDGVGEIAPKKQINQPYF